MDLHHRLARLKRLSPASLSRTVARRLTSPGRRLMEKALYRPDGPRRKSPAVDVSPVGLFHTPSGFGEGFRAAFPREAEALIATARAAVAGTVDLFGRPVDLTARLENGRFPWHMDPLTGVSWDPRAWFENVRFGRGADIRAAWELSRCGHFVTLGQAYVLTKDEAFAKVFSDQMEDWIHRNPPKFGVNWTSSMEAALRAANWLAAWDLFHRSPSISDTLRRDFPAVLWEHGHHISSHLEWGGELSTNHYLANLLGLWYIGRALGQADWAAFAGEELVAGLLDQTRVDGMDFEASTAYHRLVTEIGFYFCLLEPTVDRNADPSARREALSRAFGVSFVERLGAMFRLPRNLAAPNGLVPLIGDNDSARVHPLSRRPDADLSYLGDFGALLMGEADARLAALPGGPESAWLFGVPAATGLAGVGGMSVPSRAPGAAGIAVLRGENDAAWLLSQPNGTRGIGNHTHNDKLSVLISVGADDFLVDPGTAAYTADPARRNLFRSTRSHSTVMLDGLEQNRFSPDNLFVIVDDTRLTAGDYRDGIRVEASHDGYRRLENPIVHRRSLERVGEPLGWIIEDELAGQGRHRADWCFVAGPGIRVRIEESTVFFDGVEGVLEMRTHPASFKFHLTDGEVAPAYGTASPATFLRATWSGRAPFRVTFTITYKRKV